MTLKIQRAGKAALCLSAVLLSFLPLNANAVKADFDGDGRSDVLWRNAASGENYVYPMDGTTIGAGEGYARAVADQSWRVAGLGDFDGDGKDDVLWRNSSSGENYAYFMNALEIRAEGYLRTVADLHWQVAGVGDFDGDGKADILWRNGSSGENYLYPMSGTSIKATEGYLRTVAQPAWRIKGVADFDGDGKADVLWRNVATGENYLYFMDGTTIKPAEGYLRAVADLAWQIAAVGDYDGDGKTDILWRNSSSGENYLYPMDGTTILPSEGYLRAVTDQSWRVVFGPAARPTSPGELVINEVDYDTVGAAEDMEFIEIFNPSAAAVDLSTLALVLVNGQNSLEYRRANLSDAGPVLVPGAFLVIGSAGVLAALPPGTLAIQIPNNTVQNGAPDGIALFDIRTNTLIDALSYEGSIMAATINGAPGTYSLVEGTALSVTVADSNASAASLIRSPNGNDTNNASTDWSLTTTPTP